METRASTKRKASAAVPSPPVSKKGKKGKSTLSGQPDTETTPSGAAGVDSGSVETEGKEKGSTVQFDDLKFYSPAIRYRTRKEFKILSHSRGIEFLDSLSDAMLERGIIPRQLEDMIDEPVNDHSIADIGPWKDENLQPMRAEIPTILDHAGRYRHAGSEDNLCNEVIVCVLRLALSISGGSGKWFSVAAENIAPSSNHPTIYNRPVSLKRVDYVIGCPFENGELYQFDEIFKRSNQVVEEYSVNQTRGGIKTIPIFLDIKVKKLDNRDPLIQAAIWCAAGIKKKLRAGWTTELPCPIILVKEDTWLLYIGVYQDGDTLYISGPWEIGSTISEKSTFKLLASLVAISQWGMMVFRPWVLRNILKETT